MKRREETFTIDAIFGRADDPEPPVAATSAEPSAVLLEPLWLPVKWVSVA
jgi:hypothetical protein